MVMHKCVCVCVDVVLCYVPGSTVVSSSFALHTFITTNKSIRMYLQVARSTWSIDLFLHFE